MSFDDLRKVRLEGANPETKRAFTTAIGAMSRHRKNDQAYKEMKERGDFKGLPEGWAVLFVNGVFITASPDFDYLDRLGGDSEWMQVVPNPKKFPEEKQSPQDVLQKWIWARYYAILRFLDQL